MKKLVISSLVVGLFFIGCGSATPEIKKEVKKVDINTTKVEKVVKKDINKDSRYNDKIRNVGRLKKSSKTTKIDSKQGTKTKSKDFMKRIRNIGRLKSTEGVEKVK